MTTDHFHVLLDCKKTYINKLTDIITEPIRKKLFDIYNYSKQLCNTNRDKQNVLKQFQNELVFIPKWDNTVITEQISNICNSKNINWLDELLKGIFISNNKIINLINNERVVHIEIPNTKLFIHTLYINIARDCWKNPYIFYHNYNNQQIIDNIDKINKLISTNILRTIEYFLPIENIVKTLVESLQTNKDVNIKTLHLDKEYKTKLEQRERVLKISEQALKKTEQKLKDKEDKIIKIKIASEADIHKKTKEILKKEEEILRKQIRVETDAQQLKDKAEEEAEAERIAKQTEDKKEEEARRLQEEQADKAQADTKKLQEQNETRQLQEHNEEKTVNIDKSDKTVKIDKIDTSVKIDKIVKIDTSDKTDKTEETTTLIQQEEEIRNKKLDNAVDIAKLSSELAEKITTSAEIEVQKLKNIQSIELDVTNFDKEKHIHLRIDKDTTNDQDSLHSDDEISFFNDARLF